MLEIIFNTSINSQLEPEGVHLPLTSIDSARLLSLIPSGEFTFLTLKAPFAMEHVAITNQGGTLVMERGVNGTQAQRFPHGSCVFFENSTAVTKWLICNHDCCADNPCDCVPVAVAGTHSPGGKVGDVWTGVAVFSGTGPIRIGASSRPSWMIATVGSNAIILSGIPTSPGTVTVSVAAANCGDEVATAVLTFTVV